MCSWALAMSRASGLVGAAVVVVVVVVDVVAVAGAGECSIAAVEHQRRDETEPEAALAVPGEPSDRQKDGVVVVVVDTAGTLVLVVLVVEEEQDSRTPERRIERVVVLDSSNHLPWPSCWHFSAARSVFLDGTSLA